MKNLRGSLLFAQSGGPTAVINAGAAGAVSAAMKNPQVTRVLGAIHGIKGVLTEHLFDLSKEDPKEIELLKTTPSAAFGSVRYRLKNWQDDESDYLTIYRVFQKYDVRFFLYSGGIPGVFFNIINDILLCEATECNGFKGVVLHRPTTFFFLSCATLAQNTCIYKSLKKSENFFKKTLAFFFEPCYYN